MIWSLFGAGSQVDAMDTNGNTPLLLACSQQHVDAIRLLLKHNANVDQRTELGATALMFSAQAGCKEAVKLLLGITKQFL